MADAETSFFAISVGHFTAMRRGLWYGCGTASRGTGLLEGCFLPGLGTIMRVDVERYVRGRVPKQKLNLFDVQTRLEAPRRVSVPKDVRRNMSLCLHAGDLSRRFRRGSKAIMHETPKTPEGGAVMRFASFLAKHE